MRDGDQVKLGDVVIKLDDTQTRANLQIVTKGLDELWRARAREEAELEGEQERHRFPPSCWRARTIRKSRASSAARASCSRRGARRARRPEGAARRARLPVRGGDPRPHGAGRLQGEADRMDPAGAGRRARSVGQEARAVQSRHVARARTGAPRRRARTAHRLDRPGQGQDLGDEDPDSADRSGHAHRGRQGPRRNPRQDAPS